MERLDFRLYSVTSTPFSLLTAAFIMGGVYSPKLVAARLNRSDKSKLLIVTIVAFGLILITTSAWMISTKLEFFRLCLRELITCYPIGYCGGLVACLLRKK